MSDATEGAVLPSRVVPRGLEESMRKALATSALLPQLRHAEFRLASPCLRQCLRPTSGATGRRVTAGRGESLRHQ